MRNIYIGVAIAAALIGGIWWVNRPSGEMRQLTSAELRQLTSAERRPVVSAAMHGAGSDAPAPQASGFKVPLLSTDAKRGKLAFEENCVSCHGVNGAGSENGPPFIHKIYEPSHHGDAAFYLAARNGVRAHHWRFGDMPPVEGVSDQEVEYIVAYVREVQRANGIQ